MIRLTRLNHVPLMVNSDLIEHVEVTPDTVISLTTGQKFMVLESAEAVRDRIIEFRRAINHHCWDSDCPRADKQTSGEALDEDGDGE